MLLIFILIKAILFLFQPLTSQ